jgi:ankyrin repeat protein
VVVGTAVGWPDGWRVGWPESLALLLKHPDIDVSAQSNRERKTVLHLACQYGSRKVVSLLLSDGRIDVDSVDKKVT